MPDLNSRKSSTVDKSNMEPVAPTVYAFLPNTKNLLSPQGNSAPNRDGLPVDPASDIYTTRFHPDRPTFSRDLPSNPSQIKGISGQANSYAKALAAQALKSTVDVTPTSTAPAPIFSSAAGQKGIFTIKFTKPNVYYPMLTEIEFANDSGFTTGTVAFYFEGTSFTHELPQVTKYIRARNAFVANGQVQPYSAWTAYPTAVSSGHPVDDTVASGSYDNGTALIDQIEDGDTYSRTLASYVSQGVPYNYQGSWSSANHYVQGDEVDYSGNYWLALNDSTNSVPTTSNGDWRLLGPTSLDHLGDGTLRRTFRVVSVGNSSTSEPIASGLYGQGNVAIGSAGRSYNVHVIDRATGNINSSTTYDVFSSSANATAMASALNALGSDKIVIILADDEPQINHTAGGLPDAIYRCGGSRTIFSSANFKYRSSYILIGIPGIGEGNGLELYSGDTDSDTDAWLDTAVKFQDGNVQLGGLSARNAVDLSYADGTTVEALQPGEAGADATAGHANDINFISSSAPASPQTGWLWADTSTSPATVKRYNGSGWDTVGTVNLSLDDVPDSPTYVKGTVSGSAQNMIDNGNFEASDALPPAGWINGAYAGAPAGIGNATLSWETASPYAGNRSLIIASSSTYHGAVSARRYSVVPGEQYLFKFRAKYISGSVSMVGVLKASSGTDNLGTSFVFVHTTDTSWEQYSAQITIPSGATLMLAYFVSAGGAATVAIDEVSLVPLQPTERIKNNAVNANGEYSSSGGQSIGTSETTIGSVTISTDGGTVEVFAKASGAGTGVTQTIAYRLYKGSSSGSLIDSVSVGMSNTVRGCSAALMAIDSTPGSSQQYTLTAQGSTTGMYAYWTVIIASNRKK